MIIQVTQQQTSYTINLKYLVTLATYQDGSIQLRTIDGQTYNFTAEEWANRQPYPDIETALTPPQKPSPEPPKPTQPVAPTTNNNNRQSILFTVGHADLVAKRLAYEEMIRRRQRAIVGGSTNYKQIALDDGPPYCETCRVDMVKQVIPNGYPNSGKNVWVCSKRCGNWEADELS